MSSPYRRPNAWRSSADSSLDTISAARPPFHPPTTASASSSIPNLVNNPSTPARAYQPSASSVASNLYTPAAASTASSSTPNTYSSAIAGGNRFTNVPVPPVNPSFLTSNIGAYQPTSSNLSRIPVEPPLLSGGSSGGGVPQRLSEEKEPESGSISGRRQAKPPPILTVPDSGAQTPSVRVQVIPPSPPRTTPVAIASPSEPVQRQEPSVSATGRSTTAGDSKEPSLSDDNRRTSLSSNDNSLSEKGPLLINASQTLKPLATPVPQTLSTLPVPQPQTAGATIFQPSLTPQKPMLPPLALPTQPVQSAPTPTPAPAVPAAAPTPMAMPPMPPMGYNPYPFGMPPVGGAARPMPPFAPYPPYPIPVSIVSFGPPPPFMVPPVQNKAVQLPPQQAPAAVPNRPTTPQPQPQPAPTAVKITPVKSVAEAKTASPVEPSSPSILKLRSLRDSAPTKTEIEMAAERRRNRDCTMLFLWILTALAMVSMAFHLHRYDFDKILYFTFAGAALGLVIVGFILLVAGILLIFVGRSIYERFVSLVLFHSFLALVLSYLLYLPILIRYIPSTRYTSTYVLLQLSTLTDTFSSSASIVATLVVHSVTIGVFYFLLIKIFLARGDPDTTSNELSQTEKIELHAALVSVENYETERASLNDTINKLKRTLNESQEKHLDKQREMDRERRNHHEELKRVGQEKEDLAAILDGLDESVANASDPNKNQKELYQERLQHLQGTHNMELKKLMNDIEDYRKYNISQEKEIAMLREQYLKESARAKSSETELAIIQMQLRDAGLEQSRILALEEQLKNVRAEYERIWALHEKDTADLVLARQGSCLHCEENKNKYQHLREKHIALEKVNEINSQLQKVIESLKQQLVDAHKRHLTQEQRTKKKVEQIEEDLEAFDQFTQKMDSKH